MTTTSKRTINAGIIVEGQVSGGNYAGLDLIISGNKVVSTDKPMDVKHLENEVISTDEFVVNITRKVRNNGTSILSIDSPFLVVRVEANEKVTEKVMEGFKSILGSPDNQHLFVSGSLRLVDFPGYDTVMIRASNNELFETMSTMILDVLNMHK